MHLGLLMIVILVLIAAEEIVSLVLNHFLEHLVLLLTVFAAVLVFDLACWAACAIWPHFEALVGGNQAAHAIVDPLITVWAVIFMPLLGLDAIRDFPVTSKIFRKLFRRRVHA